MNYEFLFPVNSHVGTTTSELIPCIYYDLKQENCRSIDVLLLLITCFVLLSSCQLPVTTKREVIKIWYANVSQTGPNHPKPVFPWFFPTFFCGLQSIDWFSMVFPYIFHGFSMVFP